MLQNLFNNLSKKKGMQMLPSFNLKTLLISGTIMLLLDSVYLSLVKNYFNTLVKNIQGRDITIKTLGAVLCYLIMIIGINIFIILNGSYEKDLQNRIIYGGLLGLLIYGVYDTTNYAIFNKWDFKTVVMDTLWGGVLFSLTTFLTSFSE